MKIFVILTVLSLFVQANSVLAFDHSHKAWNEILKIYQLQNGTVKYKKLKEDTLKDPSHPFNLYLKSLESLTFEAYENLDTKTQMAFLINAYNAFTIKLILDHYPIKSIKKIGNLFKNAWKQEFFKLLGGRIQTLDSIEHKWLRPNFRDYRIHAAVNCASLSCPPLRSEAYVAKKLDDQLTQQMQLWLKDKTRNKFDFEKNVYYVSKIFDWYAEDFNKWGGGVIKVIQLHIDKRPLGGNDELPTLKYLDYNWDLNEAK